MGSLTAAKSYITVVWAEHGGNTMKQYRNKEVVANIGHQTQLAEMVQANMLKIIKMTEELELLKNQTKPAEELLDLVKQTTDIVNGIAIRVETLDNAVDVAEIRAVADPTNRWAKVYKQVNSVKVQYGVQLGNYRTLYNMGYTKEQAIEIAKTWVATGEIK